MLEAAGTFLYLQPFGAGGGRNPDLSFRLSWSLSTTTQAICAIILAEAAND